VNALQRIHAALVTGGLVIDTQPVSPHPPVETTAGRVGGLDLRDWYKIIDAVDSRVAQTIDDGLWAHEGEKWFVVTDTFGSGKELADTAKDWQGTRVPDALRRRLTTTEGPAYVHQDVRLRLLRAI
jgi:hypothetical protein